MPSSKSRSNPEAACGLNWPHAASLVSQLHICIKTTQSPLSQLFFTPRPPLSPQAIVLQQYPLSTAIRNGRENDVGIPFAIRYGCRNRTPLFVTEKTSLMNVSAAKGSAGVHILRRRPMAGKLVFQVKTTRPALFDLKDRG